MFLVEFQPMGPLLNTEERTLQAVATVPSDRLYNSAPCPATQDMLA